MRDLRNAQSLADISRHQAIARANKTALIFEGQHISYGALHERTNRVANGLIAMGVSPGDRVCYLGKNTLCYFELLLALSKAGAVLVPLNWRLAPAELAYIIDNTHCQTVVVTDEFQSALDQATVEANSEGGAQLARINVADYEQWLAGCPSLDPRADVEYEADALQLYTSGTTGKPKGVVFSNRALLVGRAREFDPASPEWNLWRDDDVSLIAMPCFHIGGTGFGLNTLYCGATGVIMSQFNVDNQLDTLVQYGITKQFIVPSALRALLEDERIHQVDLSALKYIYYGASPIPIDLMKQCIEVFGCGFVQKYGMTETSGTCVALGPEDHTIPENDKMKSVGKPLSLVELRIVDADGKTLATDCTGEIVIKSPTNMSGYWQNPEATEKAYLPGGWFRTGDAGFLDREGYLYIQDRLKDMIVSGGENVYCAEVEAALADIPAVAEVAVIGVPDKKWGEAVKACVVLKAGHSADESSLIDHCRSKIAGYKTPKSVDFLPSLPRNASGKVLKTQLRQPYWEGQERAVN